MFDGAIISRFSPEGLQRLPRITVGLGAAPGLTVSNGGAQLTLCRNAEASGSRCASEFVASVGDDIISHWRTVFPEGLLSNGKFDGIEVVVADASPDTCLALVLLKQRFAGVRLEPAWIDYAVRWEAGDVWTTGEPLHSWGALHSALVHPYFARDFGAQELRHALDLGMRYIEDLHAQGVSPHDLPEHLPSSIHALAHARLAAERQRYLHIKEQALRFQLAVPMQGLQLRRLVDAMLVIEDVPSGAMKVWLRRDTASATGDGYAVLGIYRPQLDTSKSPTISFSVDPTSGIDLKDLWEALERAEEAAWTKSGKARPRSPARQLVSYARVDCTAVSSKEPWWDDHGRYSIIGAPRALDDGSPGSLLKWTDAIQVMWDTYGPHVELSFVPRSNTQRSGSGALFGSEVTRRKPMPNCPSKWLVDLVPSLGPDRQPPLWTPTLEAACASYLSAGSVLADRLPQAGDFTVIKGRGGVVIVTHNGIMMIEAVRDAGFPADELRQLIVARAAKLQSALTLEKRIADFTGFATFAARSDQSRHRRDALATIHAILLDARQGAHEAATAELDPLLKRVDVAIESRWDATSRFEHVLAQAKEIETMIVSSGELRSGRLLDNIAVYGFPAMVFGNILGAAFAPMSGEKPWTSENPWNAFGISWPALAAYFLLTILLMLILSSTVKRINRHWASEIVKQQELRPNLERQHKS